MVVANNFCVCPPHEQCVAHRTVFCAPIPNYNLVPAHAPATVIILSTNKHFAFVMVTGQVFCDWIIRQYLEYSRLQKGRAVIQAISGRPLTAMAIFRARTIPCGICGGQNGIGTFFFHSTSDFPCHCYLTNTPYSSLSVGKAWRPSNSSGVRASMSSYYSCR